MARQDVRDLRGPSQIGGVASPVNTYVRPADPAPSPLHGIAEGLASLSAGISPLLEKRKKEGEEADKQKAQAAFFENNQVGYAEAVRRGLIPANSSPMFMKSYKAAEGALAGVQLKQKWSQAYAVWGGRDKNDPAEFQKFYRDFVKEHVGTTDPDVLAGLNPYVESLTQEAYGVYGRESDETVRRGNIRTRQNLINSSVDAAQKAGEASGKVDYDTLWQTIEAERNDAIATGASGEAFDLALIDSITTKAAESGDEDLLKLLDRKFEGNEQPLSAMQEAVEKRAQAENSMSTTRRQAIMDAEKAQEKAGKAEELALKGVITRKLAADPSADVSEEMEAVLKYDPEYRLKLNEFRKSVQDPRVEDKAKIDQFMLDVASGEMDQDEIFAEARAGNIGNSLTTLLDREEKFREDQATGGGLFQTPTAKDIRKAILDRFAQGDDAITRSITGEVIGQTDEMLEATRQFDRALIEWELANPQANILDREDAIRTIGDKILGAINTDPSVLQTDPAKFKSARDVKMDELQKATETETKKMEDQSSTPENPMYNVSEDSVRALYDVPGEPPAVETLPEGYRKQLEDTAKEQGIDPTLLNRKTWEYYRKELHGEEPLSTLRPDEEIVEPPEQGDFGLGDVLDDAYQSASNSSGDAQSEAPILDLISGAEGTGSDYNATLANGLLTGGPVDLVNMSLRDVRALQDQMLRDPDNKWNSSALGKYQIVGQTLQGLMEEMGLSDDEKFTPELQDQMALRLLERRGLSQWRNGEMDDTTFLKNLGDEWQSFALGKASPEDIISALNRGADLPKGNGLMDLVSSNKRGYTPDLGHLRPEVQQGVSNLQTAWGRDLPIVSGFRDPERNRKAGGAKHSQHQHGNAVDIDVADLSKEDRIALIKLASEQGFTGIGVYSNSIHLDYGKRRSWGPTHHDDSIPGWAQAVIGEHLKKGSA